MKTLIIDDERLARDALRRLLAAHPDVRIVAEASNCDAAVRAIEQTSPELLFLDVEMPGGSGFELLERLAAVPTVIFTTAYDAHAVRAFEVSALDYLLKPVAAARLATALERARRALAETPRNPSHPEGRSVMQQIFVRDGDRCWIVRLTDISLMESEGNYTRLHFGSHAPLIFRSLSAIAQRLEPDAFFRANRAQLVNLNWIEAVQDDLDGRLTLKLRTGRQVEVSRRQSRNLRELLSL